MVAVLSPGVPHAEVLGSWFRVSGSVHTPETRNQEPETPLDVFVPGVLWLITEQPLRLGRDDCRQGPGQTLGHLLSTGEVARQQVRQRLASQRLVGRDEERLVFQRLVLQRQTE